MPLCVGAYVCVCDLSSRGDDELIMDRHETEIKEQMREREREAEGCEDSRERSQKQEKRRKERRRFTLDGGLRREELCSGCFKVKCSLLFVHFYAERPKP